MTPEQKLEVMFHDKQQRDCEAAGFPYLHIDWRLCSCIEAYNLRQSVLANGEMDQ